MPAQTQATLRVVTVYGDPRQRGQAQGEALRAVIGDGLGRWLATIGQTHGVDPDDYLIEFLDTTHYLTAMQRWAPAALEEIRGIAEGANQPIRRVLAYNLMDEEWYFGEERRQRQSLEGRTSLPHQCTVVCLRLPGSGVPVIAQTMDIPSVHDGTQVVLHHLPDDGPEMLIFSAAGMLGLMGVNAAGIGVVVNNLAMLPHSDRGLPVACVIRGILSCTTLAGAASFVTRVPHAVGQHYAIGSPEGLASFEGAANGVVRDDRVVDRVLHTNHPLVHREVVGDPEPAYVASRTRERLACVQAAADAIVDVAGIERVLADTSAPVSREPEGGFMTFGAMIAELSVPPRARFAPGPPHLVPFVSHQLSGVSRQES
ncbi:MAG: hypothetical protein C4346_15120 [Chloroflexota bacterium]